MQIVGYDTGTPALFCATDSGVDRVGLEPGTELAYALGRRHCAGVLRDGIHRPCDEDAAPYCPTHTSTWACARCAGDCDMPLETCQEEHAVYLAAFPPDVFKVGVTRSWRLETRLREQGAVLAAHVRTVENGRRARQVEAELARELVDRVRVPTKVAGLHRSVDRDAWEGLLADFEVIDTFAFDYGLDLDERPVAETLATGTVRGVQGRVLVLDNGGTAYAVDLRDLVGHEVTTGGADRDLQSSLGAFG